MVVHSLNEPLLLDVYKRALVLSLSAQKNGMGVVSPLLSLLSHVLLCTFQKHFPHKRCLNRQLTLPLRARGSGKGRGEDVSMVVLAGKHLFRPLEVTNLLRGGNVGEM